MISLTADTNCYISALNYTGQPLRLLLLARSREIRLEISDAILTELLRVLRGRFHWDGYRLSSTKLEILGYANRVRPTETLSVVKEDPSDNRILECAIEARSDFIVSAGKHLLRIGEFRGIKILRAAEFMQRWIEA